MAKIEHLTEINRELTEEKENLLKEIDSLKTQHRKEIITALHEGVFADNDKRNWSIEVFTKSKMTIEEIKLHLDQIRYVRQKVYKS